MKGWIKISFKWSWLITLPFTIVFFYWTERTITRYYAFGVRYNPAPIKISLTRTGKLEASHLLRKFKLSFTSKVEKKKAKSSLKTINIFIPKSSLAQLNSNLPHSGFEYVQGLLLNSGKLQKVKVRYRGDFLPHWGFFKKSFRIKTKKKSLFEGMRTFNIIAPKGIFQLHNYLGYRLANYLDLMTPRSEMVNLNLNGKNRGLHILVEQLEELTLRNNGRMPGDLYVGELVGKDAYIGVNHKVFEHPGLWKKIATNNHYPENSRKPLENLIELITGPPSEKIQLELSNILDLPAWGRFSAFETLAQTFHFDSGHNWRLYFDPMRSKFEPIIWDPLPWTTGLWASINGVNPLPDLIRTRIHKALFRNGDFLRARHKALETFFNRGMDQQFLREVDHIIHIIKPIIAIDPNLNYPKLQIEKRFIKVREYIDNTFKGIREHYTKSNLEVTFANNLQGIDISINDRRPVKRTLIQYLHSIDGEISAKLQYWVDGLKVEKDVTGELSIQGAKIELLVPLMPRMQFVKGNIDIKNHLNIQRSYYKLIINGVSSDNRIIEVLVDRGSSELEIAKNVGSLEKASFSDFYAVLPKLSEIQPLVWTGDIEIEGQKVVENELIILPGTTINMKLGAALIIKNRLIAEGTSQQPIIFKPASREQDPWGTVVLEGGGANGSRMKYCEFSGGSGLKGDLFEYTAMLSVHDVKNVVIENCFFSDSRITDDMVHAVYSEIKFSDCNFERSLFDGLDIDISQVIIEGCRFIGSGNDAIDLMTSKVVILDSFVEGSGDKAVSVGEGSALLALNNRFNKNGIGVQAKDGSVAALYNIDLDNNALALDAYKKNWRYGRGGKIFLYMGRLLNNTKMITADKKSKIYVFDSFLDKTVREKRKRVRLDSTVDIGNIKNTRNNKLKRFPEEVEVMKGFDVKYWNRVNPNKRGASQTVYN